MGTAVTGENLLQVRGFHAQYLVSSQHPAPERVKARLDEVATKSLAGLLSSTLDRLFPPSDPAVLLIRRLEIEVDVNAAWERDQLARRWAMQIMRSLDIIQQGGADDENVLRFANRAAYLAWFLLDLAAGRAWGKWYYEPFDGLRMLPASAALRTAICDQPATGLAALLQIPSNDLAKVLRALTTQDARRTLDSIASSDEQNGDESRCFEALWIAWQTAELSSLQASEEWQNALRLYLSVRRDNAGPSGFTLRTMALALLRMTRRLASSSASQGRTLLAAITSGDIANLYTTAGTSDAEVLLPLFYCSADRVKEMGRAMLSRYSGHVTGEKIAESDRRYTSFGGLFLLLPFLDALPLEEATHNWPTAGDVPAAALLRFLIFVKCCWQTNAQRVFFDPLVRDIMSIDPTLSPLVVKRWQARISQSSLETFLRQVATWQYECGAANGQTLALLRSTLPGGAAAVLLDCLRGVWLDAVSYQRSKLDRLVERLHAWLSQDEQDEIVLVSEEMFAEALRSAFPHVKLKELHSAAVIQLAEKDSAIQELLARMDKLTSELSYLSIPTSFRVSRSFDLALSVAAQGVMRAFAWRLPGFARSSLPYLYSNFLDFSGSVEDEPARRVVRLRRPPLNIVLGMTGMAHKTYAVNWLDERPFAFFQEE